MESRLPKAASEVEVPHLEESNNVKQTRVIHEAIDLCLLDHNMKLLACGHLNQYQGSEGHVRSAVSLVSIGATCEDLPEGAGEYDPGTLKDCLPGIIALADPDTLDGRLRPEL